MGLRIRDANQLTNALACNARIQMYIFLVFDQPPFHNPIYKNELPFNNIGTYLGHHAECFLRFTLDNVKGIFPRRSVNKEYYLKKEICYCLLSRCILS